VVKSGTLGIENLWVSYATWKLMVNLYAMGVVWGMNRKTLGLMLLGVGLLLLLVGAAFAVSTMSQAVDSPFGTNVNISWNAGVSGIVIAVLGSCIICLGILMFLG